MGLIMLILIGIIPATYAVDLSTRSEVHSGACRLSSQTISFQMDRHAPGVAMAGYQVAGDELSGYLKTSGVATERTFAAVGTKCREISSEIAGKTNLTGVTALQRRILRTDLYLVSGL